MKTRLGFVSNSSSSSFIVKMAILTDDEIEKIMGYDRLQDYTNHDFWVMEKNDEAGIIQGATYMDNDYFKEYLGDELFNKLTFEGENY